MPESKSRPWDPARFPRTYAGMVAKLREIADYHDHPAAPGVGFLAEELEQVVRVLREEVSR